MDILKGELPVDLSRDRWHSDYTIYQYKSAVSVDVSLEARVRSFFGPQFFSFLKPHLLAYKFLI